MLKEAVDKTIYPFEEGLYPMKPCSPKVDNASHQKKMKTIVEGTDYAWEEKLDGVSIFSIGGRAFTIRDSKATGFPAEKTLQLNHITSYLKEEFGDLLIIDGEAWKRGLKANNVTSILNSAPDKSLAKQAERGLLEYHVYDIIRLPDGMWVNELPFHRRRALLENLFKMINNDYIKLNDINYDMQNAMENFAGIVASGGEGLVLKRLNAAYQFGKRPMWDMIKIKASEEIDAVIMGFEDPKKVYEGKNLENWELWEDDIPVTRFYHRGWIGTAVIGLYNEEGELEPIGRISGFNDDTREDMSRNPDKYIGEVCIARMMETNDTGGLRHASFLNMHPDKNARECRR